MRIPLAGHDGAFSFPLRISVPDVPTTIVICVYSSPTLTDTSRVFADPAELSLQYFMCFGSGWCEVGCAIIGR